MAQLGQSTFASQYPSQIAQSTYLAPAPQMVYQQAPQPVYRPAPQVIVQQAPQPVYQQAPQVVYQQPPTQVLRTSNVMVAPPAVTTYAAPVTATSYVAQPVFANSGYQNVQTPVSAFQTS